jgi:hypothetical protein
MSYPPRGDAFELNIDDAASGLASCTDRLLPPVPTCPAATAFHSTKAIDILPLITVWLQVRVLPGPPITSVSYLVFVALSATTAPETAPDTCTFRSWIGSRITNHSTRQTDGSADGEYVGRLSITATNKWAHSDTAADQEAR